jgi:phage tail sheath protein FI
MTTYPGVYMREVSSGVRPIQAASTSTAAFLGEAARGPIDEPVRIQNFTEFRATFGGFLSTTYLAHAVFQFFNNGGSQCYVVRVARNAQAAAGTIVHGGQTPHEALKLTANSKGTWGNALEVRVEQSAADPDNLFDLAVFLTSSGSKDPVERLTDLSMDPTSPGFVKSVVRIRSKYLTAEVVADPAHSEAGFLEGDKIPADQVAALLDADHRSLRVNLDDDGFQEITLAGASLDTLDKIQLALETAITRVQPLRLPAAQNPYELAKVSVEGSGDGTPKSLKITSGTKGPQSSVAVRPATANDRDAAKLLRLHSAPVRRVDGAAVLRPTPDGNPYLIGDGQPGTHLKKPVPGDDGDKPQDTDYRDAFRLLDTINDISLIAVPGVGDDTVVADGMNYCGVLRPLNDCFFIADLPQESAVKEAPFKAVTDWRDALDGANSYGAAYYPWLRMSDPNGGPEAINVPPSGFVAGIYARTDTQRGVWKTPAGIQAGVAGSVGLTRELTDVEHGILNKPEKSICVIRHFPASGTVVWGGRTLSIDSEWRYISPRRMAIFLRKSIFDGIQWAVFEPNDEPLWSQLRLNLNAFMMTLFRKGAFEGATPSEAFFVKVDSETTTQADIDLGVVNILVGFAPLKPAEFVVVQLSQKAGQSG